MFIQSRSLASLTCLLAAGLVAAALAGCSSDQSATTSSGQKISVVAAFYPLQFAAAQVGGDKVTITNLTAAGAEPHDIELTPQQVAQISDADVVLYIKGFQPAVDDAVAQEANDSAIDVGAGIDKLAPPPSEVDEAKAAGETPPVADPHIWLDPTLMATIADRITTKLTSVSANDAATFSTNAAALDKELTALDADWKAGTKTCRSRDLVVSHEAFGYLGQRYDFKQVGISGLAPDAEPSAAKVAEVSDFVRANGVTTIYFETLVDPKVAKTVATETGAKTAVLDPLEGLQEGSDEDYLSVMRTNLVAVQLGQGCT